MLKMLKILEGIWIAIGGISLLIAIYSLVITKDQEQALYFLVLGAISGLMFFLRNKQRKRIEKQANNESETE